MVLKQRWIKLIVDSINNHSMYSAILIHHLKFAAGSDSIWLPLLFPSLCINHLFKFPLILSGICDTIGRFGFIGKNIKKTVSDVFVFDKDIDNIRKKQTVNNPAFPGINKKLHKDIEKRIILLTLSFSSMIKTNIDNINIINDTNYLHKFQSMDS
ncbi:hypothetical protein BJ944DRAFT_56120 [Cunninghamella echinulata]|nr:hypothetical protein BJ944DRAFT_56120 [Cunninghamella echinulata]